MNLPGFAGLQAREGHKCRTHIWGSTETVALFLILSDQETLGNTKSLEERTHSQVNNNDVTRKRENWGLKYTQTHTITRGQRDRGSKTEHNAHMMRVWQKQLFEMTHHQSKLNIFGWYRTTYSVSRCWKLHSCNHLLSSTTSNFFLPLCRSRRLPETSATWRSCL